MIIARMAAKGIAPVHELEIKGLHCVTYSTMFGNLNGYVHLPMLHPDRVAAEFVNLTGTEEPFLFPDGITLGTNRPRGYDYVEVNVPGGWTYGPDDDGWIGFDTLHAGDVWPEYLRRQLVPETWRTRLEQLIAMDFFDDDIGAYGTLWSVEHLLDRLRQAATELAAKIKLLPGSDVGVVDLLGDDQRLVGRSLDEREDPPTPDLLATRAVGDPAPVPVDEPTSGPLNG